MRLLPFAATGQPLKPLLLANIWRHDPDVEFYEDQLVSTRNPPSLYISMSSPLFVLTEFGLPSVLLISVKLILLKA